MHRATPAPRHPAPPRAGLAALLVALIVLFAPRARAEERHCVGPATCCPAAIADALPGHVTVGIGVVLIGLSNVNERSGTWDADYYLYESWAPMAGFTPQTEIVNEVQRINEQFDVTELREGRCVRSRRLRSTLHSAYDLRMFPFDHQALTLQFSDDEFSVASVGYAAAPYTHGLDTSAREQLSGWQLEDAPAYHRDARPFAWEPGAPAYDYATFALTVRRHVTYHLSKFFLPLLLIVAVAFSMFWIDPEDLSSQVGIGVTCLLAAIAFQLAEATALPEVAYLTLADRVYVLCYFAIAAALVVSIVSNSIARGGRKELARRIDIRCRTLFPAALAVGVALACLTAFVQHG